MVESYPKLVLKPGREKSVRRRHPWVFSGAIKAVEGAPAPGGLVAVLDEGRRFLAWGHYSPSSQIRCRLVSWELDPVAEGAAFWCGRIRRALAARRELFSAEHTSGLRLVYAESDGIPGLIADLYGSVLVIQLLTVGVEALRDDLAGWLSEETGSHCKVTSVYERSDVDVRAREGLRERTRLVSGASLSGPVRIREHGLLFDVDIAAGQKTGFYLDQRDNRQRLRGIVAARTAIGHPPRVLNVFSYTGGFAVYALAGGAAEVVNVDSSAEALTAGRQNAELNEIDPARLCDVQGDAFQVLRDLRRAGETFDVIVLDPPKFAYTRRDVRSAARGYKDINLQAFHLLRRGGHLLTFSCSGSVSEDLFQKIVFGAALDAGRDVQIIGRMMQASDHPIALTFPEGAYLKGMVCRTSVA